MGCSIFLGGDGTGDGDGDGDGDGLGVGDFDDSIVFNVQAGEFAADRARSNGHLDIAELFEDFSNSSL